MQHTSRSIAIEILLEAEKTRLPVDPLQEDWLTRHTLPDPRDGQLVTAIVNGVFCQRGYLDWILSRFSKHPLRKMKPRTLQAFRVALFQLAFQSRIPPSAAIDETIKALKIARQPSWLRGYVNGVLRTAATHIPRLPHPEKIDADQLPTLARLNHPQWILDRWQDRYGLLQTKEICAGNNKPPPMVLRVNRFRISREEYLDLLAQSGIDAKVGNEGPDAILLNNRQFPEALPGYNDGYFAIQDQGAQLIPAIFGPFQQGNYLDGCAGLGGKTAGLANLLPPGSRLIAVEPQKQRLKLLKENLARLGCRDKVDIINGTLEEFAATTEENFQGILLDVPCSGLGVIRRHPEIRWHRTADDLTRYQKMQTDLLESAASLVAPNGVILYATCSTEPEENENPVRNFLQNHPEFSSTDCAPYLPPGARSCVDPSGFFHPIPNLHNMDGFFAARLVRSG